MQQYCMRIVKVERLLGEWPQQQRRRAAESVGVGQLRVRGPVGVWHCTTADVVVVTEYSVDRTSVFLGALLWRTELPAATVLHD